MEKPLKNKAVTGELSELRHDIRNQLSNIQMAIEELKHEMPENSPDVVFYIDTILTSCARINALLKE